MRGHHPHGDEYADLPATAVGSAAQRAIVVSPRTRRVALEGRAQRRRQQGRQTRRNFPARGELEFPAMPSPGSKFGSSEFPNNWSALLAFEHARYASRVVGLSPFVQMTGSGQLFRCGLEQ